MLFLNNVRLPDLPKIDFSGQGATCGYSQATCLLGINSLNLQKLNATRTKTKKEIYCKLSHRSLIEASLILRCGWMAGSDERV